MAAVQEWDEAAFAEATKTGVAMVDFYAVWCGPCKMMMSVLEKAASEFSSEEVKVGKINIENCKNLAARYNVRTIPTFIVFPRFEDFFREFFQQKSFSQRRHRLVLLHSVCF